jgi:hypothetical protein
MKTVHHEELSCARKTIRHIRSMFTPIITAATPEEEALDRALEAARARGEALLEDRLRQREPQRAVRIRRLTEAGRDALLQR